MNQPLASFPILSTTDPEEAEAVLSRELADLRLESVEDPRGFRFEMQGAHLGQTLLGYNRFDADTVIRVDDVEDVLVLVIGVGSPAVFQIDGEAIVTTESGVLVSPSRRMIIHRPAGSAIYIVRTTLGVVDDRLREVMGRHPGGMSFRRSVDLSAGAGMQARHLVGSLTESLQRDGSILENPLIRSGFNDMLLNSILALPGSHLEVILGEQPPVAPGLVRRAEEYLEAHAEGPITISDLVRHFGCSRKSLFRAFRKFRGYTPMQFLADSRLSRARAGLDSPSPADSVTSVATACGFAHLGRFSRAYRMRFGENPSETLRRARDS